MMSATAPMQVMGILTAMRMVAFTKCTTVVTSLVMRVMTEAVWSRSMFSADRAWTAPYRSPRIS